MKKLAPNLYYMDRAEWGEDTAIPRLGGPEDPRGPYPLVPRDTRVYAIFHHTVAIDNDASPSVWETIDEVKTQMRRLQTIRPDLGLDVPYNFVLFLMKDDMVIVGEGRGYDRWGAHTAGGDNRGRYFNGAGIATAFHADLENYNLILSHWIPTINYWLGHLQQVLPNLGTASPTIYPVAGHRDFSPYSSLNATACPGYYLYLRMGAFKFIAPPKEDEVMPFLTFHCTPPPGKGYKRWFLEGGRKHWLASAEDVTALENAGAIGTPVTLTVAQVKAFPGRPNPEDW